MVFSDFFLTRSVVNNNTCKYMCTAPAHARRHSIARQHGCTRTLTDTKPTPIFHTCKDRSMCVKYCKRSSQATVPEELCSYKHYPPWDNCLQVHSAQVSHLRMLHLLFQLCAHKLVIEACVPTMACSWVGQRPRACIQDTSCQPSTNIHTHTHTNTHTHMHPGSFICRHLGEGT